jgi:hypothetical protein
MRQLPFFIFLILVITSVAFSGNRSTSFTDNDLSKYKSGSDNPAPENTEPAEEISDSSITDPLEQYNMQRLKRYEIPYIAYEGAARRIIITVTFNNQITVHMLLDTGAPGMHISLRLAEELGILDNDEAKLNILVSGLGGSVPAIYTIIDSIQVGGAETTFIPTTISRSISDHFEGLIGMDFMANYSVQIDTEKHVLVLEELPESPDMPAGQNEEWWRLTFRRFNSMKARWEEYRKSLERVDMTMSHNRKVLEFAEKQYEEADALLNRLSVYASEHSVPLEWR